MNKTRAIALARKIAADYISACEEASGDELPAEEYTVDTGEEYQFSYDDFTVYLQESSEGNKFIVVYEYLQIEEKYIATSYRDRYLVWHHD